MNSPPLPVLDRGQVTGHDSICSICRQCVPGLKNRWHVEQPIDDEMQWKLRERWIQRAIQLFNSASEDVMNVDGACFAP